MGSETHMTKAKPKDSLVWLEELVEAAKTWRVSFGDPASVRLHTAHSIKLVDAVDGYRQAIKDEVEAEMAEEEKET